MGGTARGIGKDVWAQEGGGRTIEVMRESKKWVILSRKWYPSKKWMKILTGRVEGDMVFSVKM